MMESTSGSRSLAARGARFGLRPDDGLVGLLLAVYVLLGYGVGWHTGSLPPGLDAGLLLDGLTLGGAFVLGLFLFYLLKHLPMGLGGLPRAWGCLRRDHLQAPVLARFCFLYLPLLFFLHAYHGLKALIPRLHPFGWDAALMRLDHGIHLGRHPWELLAPVLEMEPLVRGLDAYYAHAWIVVLGLFLTGMVWHPDHRLRNRFYLSFLGCWILLGTVGAILFSSAGPCYFEAVTGEAGPFGPLLAALGALNADSPLLAVQLQQHLWQALEAGRFTLGAGISAMPSMHLAGAVLCTLAARRIHPLLGLLLVGHTAIILLGSVALAWHYALDGYVSIAATCLIWRLVGRIQAKGEPLP